MNFGLTPDVVRFEASRSKITSRSSLVCSASSSMSTNAISTPLNRSAIFFGSWRCSIFIVAPRPFRNFHSKLVSAGLPSHR